MRKVKLIIPLLLMLFVSIGNVWGDTYTITFKTAANDGSTTIGTSSTIANVVESGSSYVGGFTKNCDKAYQACKSGVKLGSNSATGTLEFTLASTYQTTKIKSITVKSAKYGSDSGTLTLYNGTTQLKNNITPGTDYTYTYTNAQTISSIKISTSSKRAYISEIVLVTEGGTGSTYTVLFSYIRHRVARLYRAVSPTCRCLIPHVMSFPADCIRHSLSRYRPLSRRISSATLSPCSLGDPERPSVNAEGAASA